MGLTAGESLRLPLRESYIHNGHQFRNGPEIGSVGRAATLARRCLDFRGAHMVRAPARQDVQISKELNASARTTTPDHRSILFVTLRNNWRPYHETGENPGIVTIRYSVPTTIEKTKFWQIVTIRYNWSPSTENSKIPQIVTIRHNRPPIDSPVFRSTNRGMRIAYTIRDADLLDGIDHHCLSDKEC